MRRWSSWSSGKKAESGGKACSRLGDAVACRFGGGDEEGVAGEVPGEGG